MSETERGPCLLLENYNSILNVQKFRAGEPHSLIPAERETDRQTQVWTGYYRDSSNRVKDERDKETVTARQTKREKSLFLSQYFKKPV